jgi:hypothetical protein
MFKHSVERGGFTFGYSGRKGSTWLAYVRKGDTWVEKMAVGSLEEARGLFEQWLNQYGG